MMGFKKWSTRNKLLCVFLIGIFAGILFPDWFSVNLTVFRRVSGSEFFYRIPEIQADIEVIFHLFQKRIMVVLLLYFALFVPGRKWLLAVCWLITGISFGFFGLLCTYENGFKGILLLISALFPHWVFYISAAGRIAERADRYKLCSEADEKISGELYKTEYGLSGICSILCLTLLGILSEWLISPLIVRACMIFMGM